MACPSGLDDADIVRSPPGPGDADIVMDALKEVKVRAASTGCP